MLGMSDDEGSDLALRFSGFCAALGFCFGVSFAAGFFGGSLDRSGLSSSLRSSPSAASFPLPSAPPVPGPCGWGSQGVEEVWGGARRVILESEQSNVLAGFVSHASTVGHEP
jgi:hypothetical protein